MNVFNYRTLILCKGYKMSRMYNFKLQIKRRNGPNDCINWICVPQALKDSYKSCDVYDYDTFFIFSAWYINNTILIPQDK